MNIAYQPFSLGEKANWTRIPTEIPKVVTMDENSEPHYLPIVNELSAEQLKLALLRSIDFARKSSAEVAEIKAQLDGALGLISRLEADNHHLHDLLNVGPKRLNIDRKIS